MANNEDNTLLPKDMKQTMIVCVASTKTHHEILINFEPRKQN